MFREQENQIRILQAVLLFRDQKIIQTLRMIMNVFSLLNNSTHICLRQLEICITKINYSHMIID